MVDDYIRSNEWDILDNSGHRNIKIYECCKNVPYIDLKFQLTIRRRVAFYTFILIMPCALLTCLTLVIFLVPPEAPAKLSLGKYCLAPYKYNICVYIALCVVFCKQKMTTRMSREDNLSFSSFVAKILYGHETVMFRISGTSDIRI